MVSSFQCDAGVRSRERGSQSKGMAGFPHPQKREPKSGRLLKTSLDTLRESKAASNGVVCI